MGRRWRAPGVDASRFAKHAIAAQAAVCGTRGEGRQNLSQRKVPDVRLARSLNGTACYSPYLLSTQDDANE